MGDRPAHSLAVDRFDSSKDDFAVWIKMFEDAVILAHNVTDMTTLPALCKRWLTLKLDENARSVYANVKPVTPETPLTWDAIKEQLAQLLINPQEKYNWLSQRSNLKWDGKESFHALATRVKRNVDKFDPNCNKKQEYFFRFRFALPPDYKKAIDLGCRDESQETIDEALRIAYRFLNTQNEEAAEEKTVAFTGAAMSDDRLKAIELSVQSMSVNVEDLTAKVDKLSRGDLQNEESHGYSSSRKRYDRHNSEGRRDHGGRNGHGRDRDDHNSRQGSDYDSRGDWRRRDDSYHRGDSFRRGDLRSGDDSYRHSDSRYRDNSYQRGDSYYRDFPRRDDVYRRGDSRHDDGPSHPRDSHSSSDGDRRGSYDRSGYSREGDRDRDRERGHRDRHDNRRSRGDSRSDESD